MNRALVLVPAFVLAVSMVHGSVLAQGMGQGQGQGKMGQQGMGQGMVMTQCKDEIAKHCSDVQHGSGAVHTCLTNHMKELSDKCKSALKNMGGHGSGAGHMR